jgi:leader peptidase (prepilin peptidase) / N-methyltransferase
VIATWVWTVIAALLGLAIGSFLNVVIYRVPAGESVVSPPSRCPRCGNQIRNRHNLPVLGWLMLRGRCYDCGLPISARYPLVEAATGLAFAGVTVALVTAGAGVVVVPALVLTAALITAVMIVADGHPVPRPVLLVIAAAAVISLAAAVWYALR